VIGQGAVRLFRGCRWAMLTQIRLRPLLARPPSSTCSRWPSGLDSAVIGEQQVLGQVSRRAYAAAEANRTVGRVAARSWPNAPLSVGKRGAPRNRHRRRRAAPPSCRSPWAWPEGKLGGLAGKTRRRDRRRGDGRAVRTAPSDAFRDSRTSTSSQPVVVPRAAGLARKIRESGAQSEALTLDRPGRGTWRMPDVGGQLQRARCARWFSLAERAPRAGRPRSARLLMSPPIRW